MHAVQQLTAVLTWLKTTYVGKDELIDLLGISLVAGENTFILGPPGTAKSAIVRSFSAAIDGGSTFDYLLTRFTEPNELFGPFDIRRLKEGELVTNTQGMLPEASLVFLDEIFNANSAILNSLLMALNERIFRRGQETRRLPALMFVSASNTLPDDPALSALFDRFLLRVRCDYVDPDRLEEVLSAGWSLGKAGNSTHPQITQEQVLALQEACRQVDMTGVRPDLARLVHTLRNNGITVSDRRAVKVQHLIAASALLAGRTSATVADCWVLRYIWDTEEQTEVLAGIIDSLLESVPDLPAHPMARAANQPDAESLLADVLALTAAWQQTGVTLPEQNIIKDKLRHLQSRSAWIKYPEHKQHIQAHIDELWRAMLQTV